MPSPTDLTVLCSRLRPYRAGELTLLLTRRLLSSCLIYRRSPIPLYSTFEEVRLVALYLDEALDEEEAEQKAKPSS